MGWWNHNCRFSWLFMKSNWDLRIFTKHNNPTRICFENTIHFNGDHIIFSRQNQNITVAVLHSAAPFPDLFLFSFVLFFSLNCYFFSEAFLCSWIEIHFLSNKTFSFYPVFWRNAAGCFTLLNGIIQDTAFSFLDFPFIKGYRTETPELSFFSLHILSNLLSIFSIILFLWCMSCNSWKEERLNSLWLRILPRWWTLAFILVFIENKTVFQIR
jgi:hypothetical protein